MGWLSLFVGILALATFVYNLLSKDKSVATARAVEPVSKVFKSTEKRESDSKYNLNPSEKPASQPQPPIIATIVEPDEQKDNNNITVQDQTATKSERTIPQPTLMLPPPKPSITATSASMAPPPRSQSPPRLKAPTVGRAPSAPRPTGGALRPPPSLASSLRVPVTKVLPNTSMAPSSLMPPPKKVSKQVALEPGHSPLDWAALASDPNNKLRGKDAPGTMVRVTPSQLKVQNGRKGRDAWTVYQGKVYNITPYVPFHPGGKGELLRGAGKDSAKLFMEVHPWVNWDGMLAECCVGILVGEEEAKDDIDNKLDEMD